MICMPSLSLAAVEEGRKAAFAVRGEKLAVAAARHYLAVVLTDEGAGGVGGDGAAAAQSAVIQVWYSVAWQIQI